MSEHAPGNTQDSPAELHELLTVDDVAALLKVPKRWVYDHLRERAGGRSRGASRAVGRLPHIRIGKYVRFEPRAVRAFLERLSRAAGSRSES